MHRRDARQTARADTHLAGTLRQLPETKIRDRATYLTRRASAQAQLGDLDHACHLMASAVPLAGTAPSRRNIQRIFKVRNRMSRGNRDARVRALDEQLSVLRAAL